MHASMNISTGMMFGQSHNFHDKEFETLAAWVRKTFAEVKQNIIARVFVNFLPQFLITNSLTRKILR